MALRSKPVWTYNFNNIQKNIVAFLVSTKTYKITIKALKNLFLLLHDGAAYALAPSALPLLSFGNSKLWNHHLFILFYL